MLLIQTNYKVFKFYQLHLPAFIFLLVIVFFNAVKADATMLSSANIPLDSQIYHYLDKLAGLGYIKTDVKGIKPFSKAEAARLVLEAEDTLKQENADTSLFAFQLINCLRELIPREVLLKENIEKLPHLIDINPLASMRIRYAYLDGTPRSYERPVHDPGNDGVFGIGSGLRPANPYPTPVIQRGSEGTPLSENNNGTIYQNRHNLEVRWAAEGYISDKLTGLIEPTFQYSQINSDTTIKLNRGYAKFGGDWLELEFGKDENWLGFGYRGNITLTNNAENFTQVKLSSPEPFNVKYIGAVKYALIGSRFEKTVTNGIERQPWFYAFKLSVKPTDNLEIGFNLGRQVGGPGVNNSFGDTLRGIIGGTSADNSNGLAGFEVRYRIPWLRNTELYGEFSGEDTAGFWPIVESYVAGFYIPRLSASGRDDLRFEFFQGNQILYTNGTFPEGYTYKNMPIGHSQGGATQDYFLRYSHWFNVRNNLALEYIYTNRGMVSRVPVPAQAIERKHAGRIFWTVPVHGKFDAKIGYGVETVSNLNLVNGVNQTNHLATFEIKYLY